MTTKRDVVRQDWLESERGWGCRPDGYSLHRNSDDLAQFVREYWARMPNSVPDEYSRPCGDPAIVSVDVDVYDRVVNSKNGVRYY
jgi:hypothetical protein